MTLTNSRAFDKTGETTLKITAVKSPSSEYFIPIDHPCVLGFEPMTELDKNLANVEYLNATNKNFWNQVPEIPKESITGTVQVKNDFLKLPATDWVGLIKLYSAFCCDTSKGSDLEVGGLIICHKETKQLRVVIPEQKVTKASVDWSITGTNIKGTKKMYFLDGEELSYTDFKADWDFMGMTHSHNTMFTSPSGVDDQYEVGTKAKPLPTGIHILVGSFKDFKDYEYVEPTYDVYASVSHGGQRFKIEELDELVDLPTDAEYVMNDFDSDILDIITTSKPVTVTYQKPKSYVQTSPSAQQKAFDRRSLKVDMIGNDVQAVKDLSSARHKSKSASQFLTRAAYDLLDELVQFMYDDLVQEPTEILTSIADRLALDDYDVNSTDDGFADFTNMPVGFDDPFFVGEQL